MPVVYFHNLRAFSEMPGRHGMAMWAMDSNMAHNLLTVGQQILNFYTNAVSSVM
jgi:hypothetical protein